MGLLIGRTGSFMEAGRFLWAIVIGSMSREAGVIRVKKGERK